MIFPDKETVARVRAEYPPGTKVVLEKMSDEHAPPVGTIGFVRAVDDTASLFADWSNGGRLNVLFNEDEVRKI